MDALEVLTDAERIDLLSRLLRLTDQHAVQWKEVQNARFSYWARISQHAYTVEAADHDGLAPFRLEVETAGGLTVAAIQTRAPENEIGEEINDKLRLLYELIHRFVSRSELEVRAIFQDLDDVENRIAPPF